MKKKIFLFLVLALIVVCGVFAQSGRGIEFDYSSPQTHEAKNSRDTDYGIQVTRVEQTQTGIRVYYRNIGGNLGTVYFDVRCFYHYDDMNPIMHTETERGVNRIDSWSFTQLRTQPRDITRVFITVRW